jgi:hypothetical protein
MGMSKSGIQKPEKTGKSAQGSIFSDLFLTRNPNSTPETGLGIWILEF